MPLDREKLDKAFRQSVSSLNDATAAIPDDLWSVIEASVENSGSFENEFKAYIRETTTDLKSWRTHRFWAVVIALVVMTIVMSVFLLVMFDSHLPMTIATIGDDKVKITFIATALGVVFGLTALLLRGAFAPSRKDDGPTALPENLKVLVDTISSLVSHR